MNQNEIWEPIKYFECKYKISNHGRIESLDRQDSIGRNIYGRILKPVKNTGGYLFISLESNKNLQLIHRLVAEHFIPNPGNKPFVNHIDGNKLNNHISNLEWCTAKENTQHARINNLVNVPKGKYHYFSKKVINTKTGEKYSCIREASEKTGVNYGTLVRYLNGLRKNKTDLTYID